MKRKTNTKLPTVDNIIGNFAGRPIRIIIVVVSLVMILFPLYWLLTSSLKIKGEYLSNPPVVVPSVLTGESYRSVFGKDHMLEIFLNTFIVAAASTAISVVFGSMAAYAVARGSIGKQAKKIFGLWLMMGFFEQLPKELEESAMLDGCGFTRRFFLIIFPLTKPGMIAAAILAFVGAWNEFLFACILSINKSKTLPVLIAGFITDRGLEWGPMASTAVITLVPVLILVWALQKHFVQGLAMGAVKG